jgi:glycosyltransferase involved in cell wall biosynthesis
MDMSIQVLVATIGQKENILGLLERMNIQSDAIIANQCERNVIVDFDYKGYRIKYLSFAERGVGLNRNNALMRATADICILADDDLVFVDDYVKIVKKVFNDNPNADVVIFNLIEKPPKRYIIKKQFKVRYRNFMRFGAARIAFKTKKIMKHGITFNLLFGGGATYSAGEDTLFLYDCLRNDLNIVAVPEAIARLTQIRDSTWFRGYNDKYFLDKGALFAAISRRWYWLLCLQYSVRRRKLFGKHKTWKEAFKLMLQGAQEFMRP